jgi:hypothetical protein
VGANASGELVSPNISQGLSLANRKIRRRNAWLSYFSAAASSIPRQWYSAELEEPVQVITDSGTKKA